MRCKILVYALSCLLLSCFSSAIAAEKPNQLEVLFIWKMSDELKLNSAEEKVFTVIIKELNQKKNKLNQALQASLDKLVKSHSPKVKDQELVHYRKVLQDYSRVHEEEFDRLKPVLGSDRLVKYFVIKNDLTSRIKSMLLNPDSPKPDNKKILNPPKLIEEK